MTRDRHRPRSRPSGRAPVTRTASSSPRLFRDEAGFEEEPPFNVVDLTEDPRGPKRICLRESLVETARWTLDAYPVR